MESERGHNNHRTFHNTDTIGFQAVHQTINTEKIVLNDNQSKKDDDIDDECKFVLTAWVSSSCLY